MPAPASATYSAQAKIDAHTSFLTLIGNAAKIKIYDNSDILLCTHTLTSPSGTVNGTTGQLTLTPSVAAVNATTSGTAAYATVTTSGGTVHLSLPAQQSTVAVSGKIALNSLTIVSGQPVEILSATVG